MYTKEIGEEKTKKKNITLLTRGNTTSLQFDHVEDIGEINNSLIIEAGVTKRQQKNWTIERCFCVSIG